MERSQTENENWNGNSHYWKARNERPTLRKFCLELIHIETQRRSYMALAFQVDLTEVDAAAATCDACKATLKSNRTL